MSRVSCRVPAFPFFLFRTAHIPAACPSLSFPIISTLAAHLGHSRRSVAFLPGDKVAKCISALCYAVQTEISLLIPLIRGAVTLGGACRTPWSVDPRLYGHVADISAR